MWLPPRLRVQLFIQYSNTQSCYHSEFSQHNTYFNIEPPERAREILSVQVFSFSSHKYAIPAHCPHFSHIFFPKNLSYVEAEPSYISSLPGSLKMSHKNSAWLKRFWVNSWCLIMEKPIDGDCTDLPLRRWLGDLTLTKWSLLKRELHTLWSILWDKIRGMDDG